MCQKSYCNNFDVENEKCMNCLSWDGEKCEEKKSPFFEKKVTAHHTCQMITKEG